MGIQVCKDTSDAVALYLPQRLYLKSFAKLNISVQLPPHKVHGKSISNWDLMEKFRKMIQPESFSLLKVSKHSSEVIRFDAELESRDKLDRVLARLDERVVQLNDYPDPLKVRVSEAKSDFPSRHSWDSFFRDATDMDEMKPGERPDTVHISNLPIRWFVYERDLDEDAPPSENIFKKTFEKFGSIRQVDVPVSDPFRMQMKAAMRGMSIPPQEASLYFEGYIQYNEYVSFVRCMDALRGKKLVRKSHELSEWCSIQVDFDKTKHMTDAAMKRRAIVRERLAARQKVKEDEEKAEKERLAKREAKERHKYEQTEREKLLKMREREERRKKKQLAKLMEKDNVDLNSKVVEEQKKLLKAQKKLQAVRLIEELFKRIELRPDLQRNGRERYYGAGDRAMRSRVVDKFKRQQEENVHKQRELLRSAQDGRIVIRTALEVKKPKRESSISSVSSEDSRHKRIKVEKLTTPERELAYTKAAAMYGCAPYSFGFSPYAVPGYPYAPQTSVYYPVRGSYYPEYSVRRPRGRGRGRGRGCRVPYFDGPDASQQYYKYFKRLTETEGRTDDARRSRSHTRSRSRSRRRSYSRSRSRSRRRSYTRSRSRSRSRRRERSGSRKGRRRSRSRSRRSRTSRSRSRSRSRRRSRSPNHRSRSKSTERRLLTPKGDKGKSHTPSNGKRKSESKARERSKSWSLPKDDARKAWSRSPKDI